MDSQLYYLIKDVGVPTFMVGFLCMAWYKLGQKVLDSLGRNTSVIENNTRVLDRVIDRVLK